MPRQLAPDEDKILDAAFTVKCGVATHAAEHSTGLQRTLRPQLADGPGVRSFIMFIAISERTMHCASCVFHNKVIGTTSVQQGFPTRASLARMMFYAF